MSNLSIRNAVQQKRRQRLWRRLRNILILFLIVGTMYEMWEYIHDPSFAFGSIQVSGTRKLSNDDVLKMSGQTRPVNIFNLNASRVEDALTHDVRFVRGECRYRWPGVFQVTVIERSPAVYVGDNYGSYIKIDYEGVIMSITKGIPDGSAPLLVNETLENSFVGDVVNNPRILSVLKFMNGLSFEACQDFSELSIDEYNNLQVVLKTGLKIVVGLLSDAPEKASTFMMIYNKVRGESVDVEFVDMRFNKPYVRLRQGMKKVGGK